MHGSSPVEHWPDCASVPRSVERRGTVSPGEEGWRGALGAVAPVGGWVHTAPHLCNGPGTDAGKSGEDRAWNKRFRPRDDGASRRDPRHTGAYDTTTRGPGRRATVMIAPELSATQRRAVEAFELDRWMPTLLSCMTTRPVRA